MKLGFSGTRGGMTPQQEERTAKLVEYLQPSHFHHGLCIGSDEDAHNIVRGLLLDITIVGHPPINKNLIASVTCDYRRPPAAYLKRDDAIVRETDEIIATPRTYHNIPRGSGTWYTIREAKRQGKKVTIIFPDGSTDVRKGE